MYWNSPGFEETKYDFGENTQGYLTANNAPNDFEKQPIVYQNIQQHQQDINELIDMVALMKQQHKLASFPQPKNQLKKPKYAINPTNVTPLSKRYYQVYQNKLMGSDQRDFLLDQFQLRKKILQLTLQLETQSQIKDALYAKYEVVDNQNQYLQRLLVDPDKAVHIARENKLVKVEGQKVQMNAQFKELINQKNAQLKSLTEERNQLVTENFVLQKKIQEKVFQDEPLEKQKYYYTMIELRLALENKNLFVEKLNGKLEEYMLNPFWHKQDELDQDQRIDPQKQFTQIQDQMQDLQSVIDGSDNQQNNSLAQTPLKNSNSIGQTIGPDKQQNTLQQQNSNQLITTIKKPENNQQTDQELQKQHKDLQRKYKELEDLLILKNRDLLENTKNKKFYEQTVFNLYETLKVYYQEVIEDEDVKKQYVEKIETSIKQEKQKDSQINILIEELLLNYRGIEVKVQSEMFQNQEKLKVLESEIQKRDDIQQKDYDEAKNEIVNSINKLEEAQQTIQHLEEQLQIEQQEKNQILKEFEQNKVMLMSKVSELNSEVAKILQKSDQEVSKIKIENFKNKQQVVQLMAMLTEREKEISSLRLKVTTNDEELKRLRKKNVSLNGDVTFQRPHACQQINLNKSNINVGSTPLGVTGNMNSSFHSAQKTHGSNCSHVSLPNINKRHRGRSLHNQVNAQVNNNINNQELIGDGDPFFKIRFIRTLKEWAVYWKYYQTNYDFRLQLLDKLLTTQKLREEFSLSDDIKLRVLKDSLTSCKEEMFETIVHLMAELLDLHKLDKAEIEDLDIGGRVVRCLRVPKDGEDEIEFNNLQVSALKLLSYMDMHNMYFSEVMSEELMNVNGLKILSENIKQNDKQFIKMLSLHALHLMASSKSLIPFMVSYKISAELLLNSQDMTDECLVASLALLSALVKDDQFINSISDIKGLIKLQEFLMSEENGIVANTLLCMNNLIPNFNFQKSLQKEHLLKQIGKIAGESIDVKTKLHALKLTRTLIDHGTEMEIDQINELINPFLLENILVPYGETLKEITPERDLILQTLKITSSLIEDFQHPKEEYLVEQLLKLLSCEQFKNDPKIEKNTIELIFKLWKSSEDLMVKHMLKEDIAIAICDRYLKRTTNEDLITYGLMLVGIFEKQTLNKFIVQERGDQLINQLIENSRHNDYKVALTAQRLLLFASLQKSSFIYLKQNHVAQIVKLIKKENITMEFLQMGLEIIFNFMKSPQLFQFFYSNEIFSLIFQLVFFKKIKNTKVVQNAYSCLEMIILQQLPEKREFRDKFILNTKSGYKLLQYLLKTSLMQNDRDFGKHVHFLFKNLSEESKDKLLIKSIYNVSDDFIKTMVQAKYNFKDSTPENTKEINTCLQNLSYKSKAIQQTLSKYEQLHQEQHGDDDEEDDVIKD